MLVLGGVGAAAHENPDLIACNLGPTGGIVVAIGKLDIDTLVKHGPYEVLLSVGGKGCVVGYVFRLQGLVREVALPPLSVGPRLLENGLPRRIAGREVRRLILVPRAPRHRPAKQVNHVHCRPVQVISRPLTRTRIVASLDLVSSIEIAITFIVGITTGWIEVTEVFSGWLEVGIRYRAAGQCRNAGRSSNTEVRMALGRGKLH